MSNIIVVYEPFCTLSSIIPVESPSLVIHTDSSDLRKIAQVAVDEVISLKGNTIFFKSVLPVIEEFKQLVYEIDKTITVKEME